MPAKPRASRVVAAPVAEVPEQIKHLEGWMSQHEAMAYLSLAKTSIHRLVWQTSYFDHTWEVRAVQYSADKACYLISTPALLREKARREGVEVAASPATEVPDEVKHLEGWMSIFEAAQYLGLGKTGVHRVVWDTDYIDRANDLRAVQFSADKPCYLLRVTALQREKARRERLAAERAARQAAKRPTTERRPGRRISPAI